MYYYGGNKEYIYAVWAIYNRSAHHYTCSYMSTVFMALYNLKNCECKQISFVYT